MSEKNLTLLPTTIFSLKDAMKLGVTRYKLLKAIDQGLVEKMGHGLYRRVLENSPENFDTTKFQKITTRAGTPSCICLWSALQYYDLIDEMVEQVWIYIPYSKIIRDTDAHIVRKRDADWENGVLKKDGFFITSLERTLLDCFLSKKHVSLKDAIEITKAAVRSKKTSLVKLVSLAKKMETYDRLQESLGLVA